MLQTSNSDQPAQTASPMRVVIVGKTISGPWDFYLAKGRHFEQSARMRSSVRFFAVAVATFPEMLIKCLFLTKTKHTCMIKMPYYITDADYITAKTLIRLNRSGNCCEILMSDPVCSDCAVYICNQISGHAQLSQTINLIMQIYLNRMHIFTGWSTYRQLT